MDINKFRSDKIDNSENPYAVLYKSTKTKFAKGDIKLYASLLDKANTKIKNILQLQG